MPGVLRILLLTALLGGCASQAPVEPPAESPVKASPARKAPVKPIFTPRGESSSRPRSLQGVVDDENNVFFNAGATEIDALGKLKLQRHAKRLKEDTKLELMLVGYADDQGSRSYQLAIADQRLDAVFKLMRSLGVPARQLRRYPVGREMGVPECTSAECRSSMRRVELIYQE